MKVVNKQITAAFLSFILPGSGHLYLKKTKKSISLFVMDVVIVFTLLFSESLIMKWLMGMIFFAVMIPAVVETFLLAQGKEGKGLSDSTFYIVFMLLTTGLGALPLLWQSSFSKPAKILWTIAVPLLAIAFFFLIYFFRGPIESFLKGI